MPKNVGLLEGKAIIRALDAVNKKLDELPKSFPEIQIPKSVSVDNFPPQKYPMPVTNINLNPLRGYAKSRAVTVTTTPTPLPDEVLAYRRGLVVYNNSSSTMYVGGSDVSATNGMPVPASSYSPAFDAGPKMIIYGVVASDTANVRVLELSNENIGG
jgi:predicted Zn-dependent protease with MMP-like domain